MRDFEERMGIFYRPSGEQIQYVKAGFYIAPQDRRKIGELQMREAILACYRSVFKGDILGEKYFGRNGLSFFIANASLDDVQRVSLENDDTFDLSEESFYKFDYIEESDLEKEIAERKADKAAVPVLPARKRPARRRSPEAKDLVRGVGAEYGRLHEKLLEKVKGQEPAVRKFVQGCFQGMLFDRSDKKKCPKAYFFFFGPPGTGKTLLAETAAEAMGLPCDRYDMSDFATEFSYEELIGTSQIYQNSKEGRLVEFVTDHPQCLLIFDEIEKAHMNVIRLFLQLLGSGYLRSKHSEKTIDFRDTIVIFTSNVGKELYEDRSVNLTTLPERVLIDAVKREKDAQGNQTLPNEICSRLAAGNTILFNHLSIRHLTEMVTEGFDRVVEDMKAEYDCDVDYTEKLPLLFLFNRGSEIDARIASGHSGNFLKKEIYELIRQLESRDNDQDVSSIYFDVDWDSADSELKPLFENDGKSKILVFASETVTKEFGFENCKYEVFKADTIEKARELLKHDFTAVFIDPFYGPRGGDDRTLSASNLNTEGISFFHELTEAGGRLPIYLLDVDPPFSEVDRRTLIQEGAFGVILPDGLTADGADTFSEIMDELYMEKQNLSFSGRGYVVDFKTRQETDDDGNIRIVYYDLKKRMAVDLDSRKAMLDESERPNIKFDDVIGAENAKEELTYFIRFLQNPREFILGGNKAPNGVLLYGPPGTGKTMLAKAMAGESNVSFISCAASDFANKWVGEGEENIRRLFRRAKKYAPSIIFIDEIDAIGRQRTGLDPHNETLLNTLLTQMQGFEEVDPDRPVFVLAATNYGARGGGSDKGISALDEALVRRFDNRIYVDLPNEDERKQFLDIQIKKKKAEITDDCIKNVAERTPGISLAILQNIIDLAFREADRQSVTMNDSLLLKALEDYQHGERKEQSEEYYRHVAVHETGHAYVSYLSGDAPSYITIESRGDFGGYMQHSNNEDTPSYTRDELMGRIRTSLAGRAAETVFYGKEIANNTGASSDLKNATDLAFMIISSYGMEEGQYVVLSKDEILGSPIAGDYIERVNSMIAREMENTIKLVTDGKEYIKKAADELIKKNHLTGAEFKKIMDDLGVKNPKNTEEA